MPTQPHENAHSTPYWWYRDDNHPYRGPIRHLKSYFKKVEKESNKELTKTFDNINKWINDFHIDNKISNNFWTNPTIIDAQITQLLKFRYGQYMETRENAYFGMNSFPILIVLYVESYNQTHGCIYYCVAQNHIYIKFVSTDTTKQSKKFENS
jgi:hypothetical protein